MSVNYNINLTDNALRKIHSIIEREETQDSVLRIAVSGGGCSGFKYDFTVNHISSFLSFDDIEDDDKFEDESYKEDGEDDSSNSNKYVIINDNNGNPVLVVDNCSAQFLKGSVIDYVEDLSGSGFQVKNELAKSRCGCGNSFSI